MASVNQHANENSDRASNLIPDRYIVVLEEGVSAQQVAQSHGLPPSFIYKKALNGFAGTISPVALEKLIEDSRVKYVEQDQIVEIAAQEFPTGMNRIDLETNAIANVDGVDERVNAVIAVIDTGVDGEHPDLKGKILEGYNFVGGNAAVSDDNGHGTFVAGIIAATHNDIGIKGLYDYARIIPVKVMDGNGLGTYEDAANGIIYAADNGAKVINMSIGGYGYSFMLQEAVDYALEKGCIVVAAGGNDGIEQEMYPAAYPDVIGVSAIGLDGQVWSYSNSGSHIDVSAPGDNILSTGLDGNYVYALGTSASASVVSGLVAMLISEKLDLSSSAIEQLIMQSVMDLGEKGWDKIYGGGEIDAHAAVEQEVEPFHDVAVRSVSVEPMVFEKGKPTYIEATIENTGTYKSEEFDVVLYQIVGEEKKEIGRKEGLEVIDKTKVIFEWKPERIEESVKFEVEVFSEADENSSNNSKTTYKFLLEERDGLYVLHKVEPRPVHQWIAYQAKNVWSTSELVSHMDDYPNSVWDNGNDPYLDKYGYSSAGGVDGNPEGILIGAGEEDKDTTDDDYCSYTIPYIYTFYEGPACWHFWDPDVPQDGEYDYGWTCPFGDLICELDQYGSNYNRAQQLWNNKVTWVCTCLQLAECNPL